MEYGLGILAYGVGFVYTDGYINISSTKRYLCIWELSSLRCFGIIRPDYVFGMDIVHAFYYE
jgi:hypothetical protein